MENLTEWGTFGIAAIALMQPWLIWVWKRWIAKPTVSHYERGFIELGLSILGPTISLSGSLFAPKNNIFIKTIGLDVVRKSDSEKLEFTASLFRESDSTFELGVGLKETFNLEIAHEIFIKRDYMESYNILFSNNTIRNDLITLGNKIKNSYIKKKFSKNEIDTNINISNYKEYISDNMFWLSGDYIISVYFHCNPNKASFIRRYNISINEDDVKRIRANINLIIEEIILVKNDGIYEFIYLDY